MNFLIYKNKKIKEGFYNIIAVFFLIRINLRECYIYFFIRGLTFH